MLKKSGSNYKKLHQHTTSVGVLSNDFSVAVYYTVCNNELLVHESKHKSGN